MTVPGFYEAPQHTSTIFTDKPKGVIAQEWEKAHPDCTIVSVDSNGGAVRITYQRNSEIEAARLNNENRPKPKCVGRIEDHRPHSLSRVSQRNPGIQ